MQDISSDEELASAIGKRGLKFGKNKSFDRMKQTSMLGKEPFLSILNFTKKEREKWYQVNNHGRAIDC